MSMRGWSAGWLGTYDYPQKGGGRSLINHFTDIMKASDFQSFQAMSDDPNQNAPQILAMTKLLRPRASSSSTRTCAPSSRIRSSSRPPRRDCSH
jgi:hypothetical protein